MEWLAALNNALEYLEANLDKEIDLNRIAQIAYCSSYHFQRMFSYMAGVPLSEYIRRRRMTKAAFDLQNSEDKIIDIALKYGYDSPTAFNRAFQSIHAVTPSASRQYGVSLKAFHPISFKLTIRGEVEMNYRIEKKEAFRIVGTKMSSTSTAEKQDGFTLVPKFWEEHSKKDTIPRLCAVMNNQPLGVLGVSVGDWVHSAAFDYYIAVSSTLPLPDGMHEYEVPACTWAIFQCVGAMPNAIQTMQKRIVTEWFPNSGYQYEDAPDIEVYTEGDQGADDYITWVWVPVKKSLEIN